MQQLLIKKKTSFSGIYIVRESTRTLSTSVLKARSRVQVNEVARESRPGNGPNVSSGQTTCFETMHLVLSCHELSWVWKQLCNLRSYCDDVTFAPSKVTCEQPRNQPHLTLPVKKWSTLQHVQPLHNTCVREIISTRRWRWPLSFIEEPACFSNKKPKTIIRLAEPCSLTAQMRSPSSQTHDNYSFAYKNNATINKY